MPPPPVRSPSPSSAAPERGPPPRPPAGAGVPNDRRPRGRKRARIYPYLNVELGRRLAKYCAASGTSESALVAAAVTQYLDRTDDRRLLFRQVDRLHRKLEQLKRDQDIALEAFALWTKVWFAHTPDVAMDARKHAMASAEARYRGFVERLSRVLGKGRRFVDGLELAPESSAAAGAPVSRRGDEGDDGGSR